MHVEKIIHDLLIAVDGLGSTVLFGSTDLTISSRVGMALSDHDCGTYKPDGPHGFPRLAMLALARGLNHIEREHCMLAWIGDRDRALAVLAELDPYLQRAYAKGIST